MYHDTSVLVYHFSQIDRLHNVNNYIEMPYKVVIVVTNSVIRNTITDYIHVIKSSVKNKNMEIGELKNCEETSMFTIDK